MEKVKHMSQKQKNRRKSSQAIWIVAGVAVVAVAALIGLSLSASKGKAPDPAAPKARSDQELGAKRNILGSDTAPVTLLEYNDYLCPACAQASQVVPILLGDYIAKGQVRWEVQHYILHKDAIFGSEAVECAGDQGYWWSMHEHILLNQAKGLTTKLTKDYAKELGLDTAAFNKCVDSDKYVPLIQEQHNGGEAKRLTGTPSFFINGRAIELKTWNDLKTEIEKELKK